MSEYKTLYDKIWENHLISEDDDGTSLLYVDRHLVHEVTSPQAFEGLRMSNRVVRSPEKTIAVPDHNVPTTVDREEGISNKESRIQVEALDKNAIDFGINYYPVNDIRQGIVHIIGPEQGWTLPGMTIVCGDSHTATHGAFGALAHGIGTSEVEHVLATQTLIQKKSKNMAIEGGARAGLIAPDQKTFDYLKGRPHAPKGTNWEMALNFWKMLYSDKGSKFDKLVVIDGSKIAPVVTWGTSPEDVLPINDIIPNPNDFDNQKKQAVERSLDYMGLFPGQKLEEVKIDTVFIGSCTNGRIEDLREVAKIMEGKKVKEGIRAMIVPGSGLVREQAEEEGIAQKLKEAGFEWRLAGCSMCLAMNPDQLNPKERCAATSNRNFEGRQGRGGRTHLMSPAMAAAAAITGHLTDVRNLI